MTSTSIHVPLDICVNIIVEQHKILVKMVSMLDDSYFYLFPNPNCL